MEEQVDIMLKINNLDGGPDDIENLKYFEGCSVSN